MLILSLSQKRYIYLHLINCQVFQQKISYTIYYDFWKYLILLKRKMSKEETFIEFFYATFKLGTREVFKNFL